MVKVSIVVPVYNVEKYLRKCLNSLVGQTLKEIEIIVVNDGSTDGSQKIIDEFVDNYPGKIKCLIKENGGLSDARNYGMPYCSGEYIGFVDSDDYVDTKMYELLYTNAKANRSDMVTCDYYMVYGNNDLRRVNSRDFTSKKDMLIAPKAAAWNKIYRRKILLEHDILFPKGLIYEDTLFFAKCIPHMEKVSYVSEPLVFYVQREGSIANTQGRKTQQIFRIFSEIVDYYKKNGFWEEYHTELEYYCIRITFGSNLARVCRVKDKKLRKVLAIESMTKLQDLFPNYKNNYYLKNKKTMRHVFVRMLSENNIVLFSEILHFAYGKKEQRLFKNESRC